jgi:hypothetical protein
VKEVNQKRLHSEFMILWKKQNYGDIKVIGGFRDWKEWWTDWAQRIFRTVKMVCTILVCWIYAIIHLSKPTKCALSRVSLNVDYGIWVMVCPCKFTNISKCATSDICMKEGCTWTVSLGSSQFCCEPKPAFTIITYNFLWTKWP